MAASPIEVESRQERRFCLLTGGTVRGDDGEGGRLAASLRYAARLAGQVEFLLDVGTLEELATVSEEAITAVVTHDDAGGVGLSVRVGRQAYRQAKVLTVVGGADVQVALAHCVWRVHHMPGVRWGAIIADDGRVVGASLPQSGATHSHPELKVPDVGVRALAVLGSIEESLRESWVRLTYERATLLVAGVGTHCLYAVVDQVRPSPFGEALDEVRAILAAYDLSAAATLATESVDPITDIEGEPAVAASVHAPPACVIEPWRRGSRRSRGAVCSAVDLEESPYGRPFSGVDSPCWGSDSCLSGEHVDGVIRTRARPGTGAVRRTP